MINYLCICRGTQTTGVPKTLDAWLLTRKKKGEKRGEIWVMCIKKKKKEEMFLQLLKYNLLKKTLNHLLDTTDYISHFRMPVWAARYYAG